MTWLRSGQPATTGADGRARRALTGLATVAVALAGLTGCSAAGTPEGAAEEMLDALATGDVQRFQAVTGLPDEDALLTMLPNATERISAASVVEVEAANDQESTRTVQIEYSLDGQRYADSVEAFKDADSGDWLIAPPAVPVAASTGTVFTLGGVILGAESADGAADNGAGEALPGTYPIEMTATLVGLTEDEVTVAPADGDTPVTVPAAVNEPELATAARVAARTAIETCLDGGMTLESAPTKCLGSFAGHSPGPTKFETVRLLGDVPELALESGEADDYGRFVLTMTATDPLPVQTTLKNSLYVDAEDTVTTENLNLRVELLLDATGSAIQWISVDGWEAR